VDVDQIPVHGLKEATIAQPAFPSSSAPPERRPAARPAWLRSLSLASTDLKGHAGELRRLWAFTRPYRGRLLLAWLATAGYAGAGALLAYTIKPIFDEALIGGVNTGRIAATVLLLYLVKGVSAYFSTTLVASAGQRAVTDLRCWLYEHVLNQSFAFIGRHSTGRLMSRLTTDVEKVQIAVGELAGEFLKEGLTVLGLLGILFYLDWQLALIALVGMPAAFYPLVRLGRRMRSSSETSLRRWQDISEILHETLSGFRIVKAFAMERFEIERFRRASARLLTVNLRLTRTHAVLPPLMEAVGGLALVGGLFLGSYRIHQHGLSPGAFVAFLSALFMMYTPIKRLSHGTASLQAALAAGTRIFEVLDTHQEVPEAPDAIELPRMRRQVAYRNVGFRYADGDGVVLRRVSLEARSGEIVAIVGTSGAGKTTLVNLLPRFHEVTEGAITLDGVDIRKGSLASLRAQIGLVTQETVLFNDTVRANIAYGLREVDEARVEAAARAALAHDFILDLPRRYDTVIGERGSRLSGGQRQRIAIARALLKDPPILILDEATSALDAESERLVQQALLNLMKGRTTLVIAHRMATVRSASRIVVLDGGEVSEIGSHEELLRRGGLYARLHELQFADEAAL